MRGAPAALATLLAALAGCDGASPAPEAASELPAQFAIRGRWDDAMHIRYRIENGNSPIGDAAFARAVERAIGVWAATGVVGFLPAEAGQEASVTLGWRAGHHGACEPFGPSTDVAHCGPTAPGTFVHFDRGRSWSENGESGASVFHTALHELGHVLGLGHSEEPTAVMSTIGTRAAALTRHDLAGLHSLYGGGQDQIGDLRIARRDAGTTILRRVAPPDSCGFSTFDSDGDGDNELLVWRTDEAGHGALMIYHFTAGPRLQRTLGPFHGALAPGARVGFVTGPAGERFMLCEFTNGTRVVRQFDEHGVPLLPLAEPARELLARATASSVGDLDGDGVQETVLTASTQR